MPTGRSPRATSSAARPPGCPRARRSPASWASSRCRAAECGLGEHGWDRETPLWFYILREASVRHDGDRLGDVGGRIVGEVLSGSSTPTRKAFALFSRTGGPRCRAPSLAATGSSTCCGRRSWKGRERPTRGPPRRGRRRGMGGRPQRSPLNGGRAASSRRPAGSVRGRRFDRPPGGDAARAAATCGRSGAPGALVRLGVRHRVRSSSRSRGSVRCGGRPRDRGAGPRRDRPQIPQHSRPAPSTSGGRPSGVRSRRWVGAEAAAGIFVSDPRRL